MILFTKPKTDVRSVPIGSARTTSRRRQIHITHGVIDVEAGDFMSRDGCNEREEEYKSGSKEIVVGHREIFRLWSLDSLNHFAIKSLNHLTFKSPSLCYVFFAFVFFLDRVCFIRVFIRVINS